MQLLLWAVVGLINVITLAAFGIDKAKARRQGARRIPEATLLGLMFCGGFVGGWVAMSLFRHKTVKFSFRWRAVVVSLLSPAWLLVWWWWRSSGSA